MAAWRGYRTGDFFGTLMGQPCFYRPLRPLVSVKKSLPCSGAFSEIELAYVFVRKTVKM